MYNKDDSHFRPGSSLLRPLGCQQWTRMDLLACFLFTFLAATASALEATAVPEAASAVQVASAVPDSGAVQEASPPGATR